MRYELIFDTHETLDILVLMEGEGASQCERLDPSPALDRAVASATATLDRVLTKRAETEA